MATLVDHQLRNLCKMRGLVEPYSPEMINPASIDVTLGATLLREGDPSKGEDRWVEVDIENGVYSWSPVSSSWRPTRAVRSRTTWSASST